MEDGLQRLHRELGVTPPRAVQARLHFNEAAAKRLSIEAVLRCGPPPPRPAVLLHLSAQQHCRKAQLEPHHGSSCRSSNPGAPTRCLTVLGCLPDLSSPLPQRAQRVRQPAVLERERQPAGLRLGRPQGAAVGCAWAQAACCV
jgi:hypothetical protein